MRNLLLILTLGFSGAAFADDPEIYSHKRHGAIKGYDVVAFFSLREGEEAIKGSKDITYEWKGAQWRFANDENRQRFIKTPDAFVPEYGGYCAFAVAHGFVTSPRPDNWKIVDGKLYLNNNKNSLDIWVADQQNKITKADANWPEVLKD